MMPSLLDAEELLGQLVDEIRSVENRIDAIGVVTLEKETLIQAAREAYEQLPADSKPGVSNYSVLTAAEEKLQSLKKPADPQEPPTGDENQYPVTGEYGQSNVLVWSMLICGTVALSILLRKRQLISSNHKQ